MKTPQQIRRKIKDVAFRLLQKRLEKELKVVPCNCVYNHRVILDPKSADKKDMGICIYGLKDKDKWSGKVCDSPEDICSKFTYKKTKEDIKKELQKQLNDSEYVSTHYKHLAALRWVLDEFEDEFILDRDWSFSNKLAFMLFPLRKKPPMIEDITIEVSDE